MKYRIIFFSIMNAFAITACVSTGETKSNTAQSQSSGGSVTPSNIYDVCMPIELKEAVKKKQADSKAYTHYICTYYAKTCKQKPEGGSCQKAIHRYSWN